METNLERLKHIRKMVQAIKNYTPIQNSEGNSFIAYFRYKYDHSKSLENAYEKENLSCNDLQEGCYYKVNSDMKKVSKIKLNEIVSHVTEWSMETGEKWIDWKPINNAKY